MAEISASMVKELREMTGAGMMDCKKALVATEGNPVKRRCQKRIQIRVITCHNKLRHLCYKCLELLILCHEVSFGIHFHDCRHLITACSDLADSLRSNAACLCFCLCLSVLP